MDISNPLEPIEVGYYEAFPERMRKLVLSEGLVYGYQEHVRSNYFGGGGLYVLRFRAEPPTYTISGRVTDASGAGIPGVAVSAGSSLSTTTDANGYYTFTGLPAGTYTLRPEKAPYAFSPASRPVTVPPNGTGVDFQAVSITKIQVNQVLGNTTNYVAGKDTAVRVFMSDAVPFDPDHQQLQIYRNGNLITQTPLKPRKFSGRSDVLDFLCDRQECDAWQKGFYTFEARVNGDYLSQPSVEFKERRKLKVRIVPVRIGSLTPTSDGLANVPDLARQLFPMGRDDLEIVTERELDATAITFDADTGYDPLYPKLRERHPLWWRWLCQPLPSAWLLPNCYSDIVVGVLPDVDLWPESWRTPGQTRYESLTSIVRELKNMGWTQQVFAHEVGHLVGYDKGTHSGLGDEYDGYCGVFQCSNNPPPNTFVGRDGIDATCMTVPTCPTQNAPNWVYEEGMGSMVLGTGPDQDYPFNVMASRALTDSLSFMGKGAEKDSRYWVTPRAYNYMFGALARGVIIASAPRAQERVALVEGRIDSNDSVSLAPIYHMTTIPPPAGIGSYTLEVLDAAQAVLAQQQFEVSFLVLSNPPREATSAPFAAAVRLPAGAKAVRVMHNDVILTQVSVTSHTPTLSLTSPTAGQTWAATGNYTIRWQGNDLDGDTLYYTVLYRQGAGDWIVLGGDLTTSELTVDAAGLPGGTAAQVQVWATDGVNTTVAESGLFTVGRKGPQAFITYPADGARFMPGVSFFLQGTAYDLEDGALPDSAYRWTSDRDGDLGTGATNLVILSPGPHVITLTVTDSDGNRATATVRLWAGSEQFMPLILRGR